MNIKMCEKGQRGKNIDVKNSPHQKRKEKFLIVGNIGTGTLRLPILRNIKVEGKTKQNKKKLLSPPKREKTK